MLLQNLGQSDGVCGFIDFIASPIVGPGDLLVQRGHPGADELTLLCAKLLFQQHRKPFFGIVENIKVDAVLVPMRFGKDAVFS